MTGNSSMVEFELDVPVDRMPMSRGCTSAHLGELKR